MAVRKDYQVNACIEYLKQHGSATISELKNCVVMNSNNAIILDENGFYNTYKPTQHISMSVDMLAQHLRMDKRVEKIPDTRPTQWRVIE